MLQKICNGLDISLARFFAIEGDSYTTLSNNQRNLVETYDELDDAGKQLLMAYAKGLADMQKAQK